MDEGNDQGAVWGRCLALDVVEGLAPACLISEYEIII